MQTLGGLKNKMYKIKSMVGKIDMAMILVPVKSGVLSWIYLFGEKSFGPELPKGLPPRKFYKMSMR